MVELAEVLRILQVAIEVSAILAVPALPLVWPLNNCAAPATLHCACKSGFLYSTSLHQRAGTRTVLLMSAPLLLFAEALREL